MCCKYDCHYVSVCVHHIVLSFFLNFSFSLDSQKKKSPKTNPFFNIAGKKLWGDDGTDALPSNVVLLLARVVFVF